MIYYDNAATTKCSDESIGIVNKYLGNYYFNPSSMYHEGIEVKRQLNDARLSILKCLRADGKLVFTSGGSESDNLALLGTKKAKNSRIIISATEHAAIYQSAMELKQRGYDVVLCPVDHIGKVNEDEFATLVTSNTSLISIIHVNNETGAINDIKKLVKIAKEINPKVIFHSDGVQAFGKIPLNLRDLDVDAYSVSAHKIHAPKGSGALFVKNNINLQPIIYGGGQEDGIRSSTENVASHIAFSTMAKYAYDNGCFVDKISEIKDKIADYLVKLPNLRLISNDTTSPFILTFASTVVRGEVMQHALEKEGVLVGTGSACSSNKASKRIAEAIALKGKEVDGIVRLSFSRNNDVSEVPYFCQKFGEIYQNLSKYGS